MADLHHFDRDGYYTGSSDVPVNPVTGKPFTINERVATLDPLPAHDLEAERVRRIDGVWMVEAIPMPEPEIVSASEPVASIESLRDNALASVKSWRIWKEQQEITFEYNGHVWDGGLTTRQRLKPVLSLSELPTGFFWTDHDNNDVPVTLADLVELDAAHEAALVAEGFRIHIAQRQMKTEVALMSREQLEAFDPEHWLSQKANLEPAE